MHERIAKINPVKATDLLVNHHLTMNCAKIGKHRRGTLMLEMLSYDLDTWLLRYRLVPNVGYVTKIYDRKTKRVYKFMKRRITDFRWLLRS